MVFDEKFYLLLLYWCSSRGELFFFSFGIFQNLVFIFSFLQFKCEMLRCSFFLEFILLGVFLASWIGSLIFVINFIKLWVVILSNILSAPFSFFSLFSIPIRILINFWNCPSILGYSFFPSCFSFPFFFPFQFESLYWCIIKIIFSLSSLPMSLTKAFHSSFLLKYCWLLDSFYIFS